MTQIRAFNQPSASNLCVQARNRVLEVTELSQMSVTAAQPRPILMILGGTDLLLHHQSDTKPSMRACSIDP